MLEIAPWLAVEWLCSLPLGYKQPLPLPSGGGRGLECLRSVRFWAQVVALNEVTPLRGVELAFGLPLSCS